MKALEITIPIKTPNPVNGAHHGWRVAAGIRKEQKASALKLIPRIDLEPVVEVRLTRLSAGRLDEDNLRASLKAVRDAVAYRLRVDDASGLVRWEYEQAEAPRGEQAVRVSVRWLVRPDARTGAADALARVLALPPLESGVLACSEAPPAVMDPPSPWRAPERGGKP